ncbi:hypothetical protein G9C98_000897 [Cotesia typhae]|uniref:Uncharacterized protein n=1 Tax=Cotesia typhae TaxID=2053667 RepID=A0A8J5RFM7_9HYME|nr:hypothetical protein G9C98_000897 [Cotesia typhae]
MTSLHFNPQWITERKPRKQIRILSYKSNLYKTNRIIFFAENRAARVEEYLLSKLIINKYFIVL